MENPIRAFEDIILAQGHTLAQLGFRPGASDADIAEVEAATGITLPAALRTLLSHADGQEEEGEEFHFLPGCGCARLLSCAEIIRTWGFEQKRARQDGAMDFHDRYQDGDRIRGNLHSESRLIFAELPGIVMAAIDMDPGPAGTPGQVITDITECDFVVLADSFEDYAAKIVRLMQTQALRITPSDDFECLILARPDGELMEAEEFIAAHP